jgi:hypothetical protein
MRLHGQHHIGLDADPHAIGRKDGALPAHSHHAAMPPCAANIARARGGPARPSAPGPDRPVVATRRGYGCHSCRAWDCLWAHKPCTTIIHHTQPLRNR